MYNEGAIRPAGSLGITVIHHPNRDRLDRLLAGYQPHSDLGILVARAIPHLPRELAADLLDRLRSVLVVETSLSITVLRNLAAFQAGLVPFSAIAIEDYGVVGCRVITNVGVNYLAACFDNTNEPENLKFHGIGTGSTAENVTDTALVTELTTEYNPDNTRTTGVNTHSTNTFTSTGTNTLDATPGAALREHGVFDVATRGSGNLWDRTVYAAITINSGDGLQTAYTGTLTAGG
jgi:hypothetical protein